MYQMQHRKTNPNPTSTVASLAMPIRARVRVRVRVRVRAPPRKVGGASGTGRQASAARSRAPAASEAPRDAPCPQGGSPASRSGKGSRCQCARQARRCSAARAACARSPGTHVYGRSVTVTRALSRSLSTRALSITLHTRTLDHSPHAHSRSLSTRAHTQCTPRLAQRLHPALALPRGGHPVAPRWRTTQTPGSGRRGQPLASGRPLGARPATRGWARACGHEASSALCWQRAVSGENLLVLRL